MDFGVVCNARGSGWSVTQRGLECKSFVDFGVVNVAEGSREAIFGRFWGGLWRRGVSRLRSRLRRRAPTQCRAVSNAMGASEALEARFARDPAQPLLHANATRKEMRASRGILHSRC